MDELNTGVRITSKSSPWESTYYILYILYYILYIIYPMHNMLQNHIPITVSPALTLLGRSY